MARKMNGKRTGSNGADTRKRTSRKWADDDSESRPSRGGSRKNDRSDKLSSLNDLSWYSKYPLLLETVSRVPFPYRPGMSLQNTRRAFDGTGAITSYTVPGVVVMRWFPTIGWSENVTDPASIAAKEIYAKVRSRFSGSLDADAPDFMIYMMALDSVFSYIGALKRIYRVLDGYSPNNFVTPNGLLHAFGLSAADADTLRKDKANLNYMINTLIKETGKFMMPDEMDIFRRHYWLNDNVYLDSPTMNAQFYVFRQEGFFKWAKLDTNGSPATDGASGLTMEVAPWSQTHKNPNTTIGGYVFNAITTDVLYNFGSSLIRALAESDDAYTMSGYLMRAYEGSQQFRVDELPIDQQFEPVYVPEVLAQIENGGSPYPYSHLGIMSSGATADTQLWGNLNVWQNPATNVVIHKPQFRPIVGQRIPDNIILSLRSDSPAPADVVLATRLRMGTKWTGTSSIPYFEVHAGTELNMGWSVITGDKSMSSSSTHLGQDSGLSLILTEGAEDATFSNQLCLFTNFDWHPLIVIDAGAQIIGDVHNVTMLPQKDMEQINRVCVFSEFNAFNE